MSDLPSGWEWARLDDIGDYLNGRPFKKSEWSQTGRPIIRIQNLTGSSSNFKYFHGTLESRHTARHGDLLISWAATLGSYLWNGPEAAINQHIFKVESHIDLRFHHHLINYLLDDLISQSHGSGMVHITRSRFGNLTFRLPPAREQKRIVAALESHLTRVSAGEASLTTAAENGSLLYDRLIATSISDSAASAEIQAELTPAGVNDEGLPRIPGGWSWKRLGEIADVAGGITKDSKNQTSEGFREVPYLRVANVQSGRLDLSTVTTIRTSEQRISELTLQPGDVLLNEGGDRDKLARCWIWQGEIPECIHQNHVFRARIRNNILHPKILAWHANSFGQRWAQANGKQSVNLASISLKVIRLMPIPIPPRAQQQSIVNSVEEGAADVERLKAAIRAGSERAVQLRRSLLAEAFSGRLIPQDPTDEPASVLLHQIRAERAAQPKARRTRRSAP